MLLAKASRVGRPLEETGQSAPEAGSEYNPLFWLLLIVAVGFVLRWWHIASPLQLDEFGPVYAIAERKTASPDRLPASSDLLVPVADWREVRARSILPYGIVNSMPLYHYLLYGLIHVLPIAEWSLRLPSLVAGLGCIIGVYVLCRRLWSAKVALLAALLTALDPIQIGASVLVRPYALANLVCVCSFYFLLLMLQPRRPRETPLGVLGYAICLAGMGYLNPVLLLVVSAHAVLVLWPLIPIKRAIGWWLVSCTLAGLLFVPEMGYVLSVREFSKNHAEYLFRVDSFSPPVLRIICVLLHNGTFIVAMNVLTAGVVLARRRKAAKKPPNAGPFGPQHPIASQSALWRWGWAWFVVPQAVALFLAVFARQPIYFSRYLSYTTMGGAIVVACWAMRDALRPVRAGTVGALAVILLLWGIAPASRGIVLFTSSGYDRIIAQLDQADKDGLWQPDDLVLFCPGYLEADLGPEHFAPSSWPHVRGVLLAPLTTLYAVRESKPVICLSLSNYRSKTVKTFAGPYFAWGSFYNDRLVNRLRASRRYWISCHSPERDAFLACLLPWMAESLGRDLHIEKPLHRGESGLDVNLDNLDEPERNFSGNVPASEPLLLLVTPKKAIPEGDR